MANVEILSEQQGQQGWTFETQVLESDGTLRRHQVTLSWADYNLWSPDGRDVPARVVQAMLDFVLDRLDADDLPSKLDASLARRRFADADATIPKLIE